MCATLHLQNDQTERKSMKVVYHAADSRGHVKHSWLDTFHSFSFGNYYNPERIHFGMLRVLNDDVIDRGMGFGKHPHDNMEIITIPLSGDLEHKDSMGNSAVIREGDVQVMSAGTGIFHSEFNANKEKEVKLLQIWVFPHTKNVEPRYDQISIRDIAQKDKFYQIVSPNSEEQGVWIYQNAWFHLGDLSSGWQGSYTLKSSDNGLYVFVISGAVRVGGSQLETRDGLAITEAQSIEFDMLEEGRILLMEVPMHSNKVNQQ